MSTSFWVKNNVKTLKNIPKIVKWNWLVLPRFFHMKVYVRSNGFYVGAIKRRFERENWTQERERERGLTQFRNKYWFTHIQSCVRSEKPQTKIGLFKIIVPTSDKDLFCNQTFLINYRTNEMKIVVKASDKIFSVIFTTHSIIKRRQRKCYRKI